MPMHYPQSESEWRQLRHQFVSSTESAALFGLGAYSTPYELGISKQAKELTEFESTERMRWGTRLQEAIAKGISDDYGVKVRRVRGYAVHPDCRMGASFDYEIVGVKEEPDVAEDGVQRGMRTVTVKDPILQQCYRDLGPGILEIKNVDRWQFKKEWKTSEEAPDEVEAPPQFEIQVQHQMEAIQTRKWAAIGVLIGGNETLLVIRDYDPKFGEKVREKIDAFWTDLDKGILPPVTLPADVDIIRKIYLSATPGKQWKGTPEQSAELVKLAAEYEAARDLAKVHDEARKSTAAKIIMLLGDAEGAVLQIDNGGVVKLTAATVGETLVPAYTRKAFRSMRITTVAAKGAKK